MKHEEDFFSCGKQAGKDRFTLPNNVTDLFYFLLEPDVLSILILSNSAKDYRESCKDNIPV